MTSTKTRARDERTMIRHPMKKFLASLVAVIAVSLSGCGKAKNPSAAGDAPPPQGTAPTAASAPPPPNVAAHAQNATAENVGGTADPFLTQQLQIFIQQKGRMPQSFSELASVRLDSIPTPPSGTKWVIDAATRQVKAAPAK